MKSYDKDRNIGYFLEITVHYPEELHELQKYLPFLPERIKIEEVENFVKNFHNIKEYVIHIRNLKQVLNHGLVFKKVHRVIKFHQKAW